MSIDVYVTDFETLVLKPETQKRIDDLPFGWQKIVDDKRYRSKQSQETRRIANALHAEITNAARDAYLRGEVLGKY